MQNLISLKTKGLARRLGFPTRLDGPNRSTFPRGLFLLVAMILLGGTIAAQNTKETKQKAAQRLIKEGQRLVDEGSATSLTKAIEKFEAARKLAHSINNVAHEADLLLELASLYSQLGQNQKALETYAHTLRLFRAARDRKGKAAALIRIGLLHSTLGEPQKALDTLDQVVVLSRRGRDRENEANALAAIATLHYSLGQHEESLSYFNKTLKLCRAIGLRELEAFALYTMTVIYKGLGQTQKARESLEQTLLVSRAFGSGHGEATVLMGFGVLYLLLDDTQKALEYFEQALTLAKAEHDRVNESNTLVGFCATHLISHDFQKAVNYCTQALALFRTSGNLHGQANALCALAIGERGRGNLAASRAALESAITLIESLRMKIMNPAFRLSFFTATHLYYEFYINLLMSLHQQYPAEGYDGKALEASERARARFLVETLTEVNAHIRQGVDAALLKREREIQRRLNARAQIQMQLFSPAHSETQAGAIADEIQQLIKELQQVETAIRQTSPRYAALTQPQPLTLKEIQTQVLDQDTLLLQYSLGGARSYLWVVTSSSITSHELPRRAKIETAARDFYKLLNARNTQNKGETNEQRVIRVAQSDEKIPLAAASLSRMVLAPAAEQLGNKRLIIVPDGALHFIPFAALPIVRDEASSANQQGTDRVPRPLIADHEIVNLPSASTLAVVRKEVAGRQIAPKSVVALADPVFMKNDERVKRAKVDNKTPVRDESTKVRQLVKAAAEDTGVVNDGSYVPRLPGTRKEAEQIVALVPATEGRLVLDFAASRDTITSVELSQYRYVHISTHGFLNSVHPELSGVVFSLVNKRGEAQDGFLRAHELFNLKLPAEVVVLSACQTGMGKNIRGEGLVSLTRGFMYAGAPRVVVSLWSVSDSGTTELMVRFYRGMLKEGMRPAAALRAAQIALMNDNRFASPYYWAPFILQGEWR